MTVSNGSIVPSRAVVSRLRRFGVGVSVAALAAACGEAPFEPQPPVAVVSATVTAGANPLVRDISVSLDGPSAIQVDYWTSARPTLRREAERSA